MQDLPNIQQTTTDIINSLAYLGSEWIIIVGFLVIILTDLFVEKSKMFVAGLAMLTLLTSGAFLVHDLINFQNSELLFNGMFVFSKSAIQFKLLIVAVSLFSLVFFYQDHRLTKHPKGINDLISIFLASILGMFLLVSSANLLMLFLSIEMISLASYLMVSYNAYQKKEAEAGMKYVLFGAVASAIMLYGISLIYGFTGTINLYGDALIIGLSQIGIGASALAIILVLAGISFKLSAVPFHFWTPDAYQVAPTSVVSFLSAAPKIAVFGFLYYLLPYFQIGDTINQFILFAAATSMILGNIAAVFQDDAKRMMAYSAIGHTGFVLMLFVMPQALILNAVLFYLAIYSIANIGVFMSLSYIENNYAVVNISGFKGLGKNIPAMGVCLVILMVSLTGIPPTAGFIAKFLVFSSLISFNSASIYITFLLVIAVLTTVVSLFYYLKIPLNFFLKKSVGDLPIARNSSVLVALAILLTFLTVLFGVFPSLLNALIG
ncbi:NADH-quinone oxidoreductase subunit N [Pedobacter arcticus]|uniref:NADH-quinone oxidoreductase subunit N n=1 Tax=Pedobacter arcticus TaxID=752140 RepID=UPI00030FEF19|nr:NADH-quinone oxidoreductase subunit N [Pedobacter arcticus]